VNRALVVSGLFHATALACLLWAIPASRPPRDPVLQGIVLATQPPPGEPERDPLPEPLPDEPAPPEVLLEWPPDAEPDPLPECEASGQEPVLRPAEGPRVVRLRTPLPHRARRAPTESAASTVERPTAPEAPARPRGETVGARLLAASGGPSVPYPEAARRRGLEGRVSLRVRIDASGDVTSVEVVESSGHGVLDRAAAGAAWHWEFEPALRDGVAVPSEIVRAVRFQLVRG
jgi:protein TonB